MAYFVFLPTWFRGYDFVLDFLSFFIILSIIFTLKSIKLLKPSKKSSVFLFSFKLLSLSYFIKIIVNGLIYLPIVDAKRLFLNNNLVVDIFKSIFVFEMGVFIYRALFMLSFYLIYSYFIRKDYLEDYFAIFLVLLVSYLSVSNYWVFFLGNLVLLSLISFNYYRKMVLPDKTNTSKKLVFAFFMVFAISNLVNILFVFSGSIVAYFLEILAFLLLFMSFKH